jgi:hypothetical protein
MSGICQRLELPTYYSLACIIITKTFLPPHTGSSHPATQNQKEVCGCMFANMDLCTGAYLPAIHTMIRSSDCYIGIGCHLFL